MNARRLFGWLLALLSAAMLGLAAGAMWILATLYTQQVQPWLALPIGLLLGLAIRRWVMPPSKPAAALAALTTLLATVYLGVLMAAIKIAGSLGLGLIDTLQTAGAGMLLKLTWLSLTPGLLGYSLVAAVLAAWLARGKRARNSQPPTAPTP